MKKYLACILASVAVGVGGTSALTASAKETATTKATVTSLVASVAPITCSPTEDSCWLAFVANNGNGYLMARQDAGTTWVRLTLVPGWDNSRIAPITCRYSTSCVTDFVGISVSPAGSYWRARQAGGSVWVRLTLVNGQ